MIAAVPMDVVGIPSYRGAFGEEQATRLLWRAGFGPAPGQAAELAKLGLHGAVQSLTQPASKRLVGPNPTTVEGGAARAARRLGPRPPVVAGPDGPHAGAAGRADDARLARLVRDVEVAACRRG